MMGETAATPYLQNHNTCKHSKFLRVQKFHEFSFCNPTPAAKLCENKAHAKISGNTVRVCLFIRLYADEAWYWPKRILCTG